MTRGVRYGIYASQCSEAMCRRYDGLEELIGRFCAGFVHYAGFIAMR